MRSGICPKCNATAIYVSPAQDGLDAGIRTGGGQPMLNIHTEKAGLFGDSFALLIFEIYVCTYCGYLEQYVSETEKLSTLPESKNWQKVEAAV